MTCCWKAKTRCTRVSGSCTSAGDRGCVCAHDPAKQLLLMHVSRASYSHVCALCESSREKQRVPVLCRCCGVRRPGRRGSPGESPLVFQVCPELCYH
jgi:hypothetical protein